MSYPEYLPKKDNYTIDRKTWRRLSEAARALAERDAQPYMRGDWIPEQTDLADEQLGVASEEGTPESGQLKFVWFGEEEPTKSLLAQFGGGEEEEELQGQIFFAKTVGDTYFYGDLRLYKHPTDAGDTGVVRYSARGRGPAPDSDLGYEFYKFTSRIGVDSVLALVDDQAMGGATEPVMLEGQVNRHQSFVIRAALGNLAAPGP